MEDFFIQCRNFNVKNDGNTEYTSARFNTTTQNTLRQIIYMYTRINYARKKISSYIDLSCLFSVIPQYPFLTYLSFFL